MRHTSKKRAAYDRLYTQQRKDYLVEFPRCMVCGQRSECVHEIARGTCRKVAFGEPCTWLATCAVCNCGPLTDAKEWPVARQLALKLLQDGKRYDRCRVNVIRGRCPEAITEAEVTAWMHTLIW